MQVHTFIADSAADAVAQIREALGPDAVVLNVRRPPVTGLARLWQKPLIEILAHVPDKPVPSVQPELLAELREELREIGRQMSEVRSQTSLRAGGSAPEAGLRPPTSDLRVSRGEAGHASSWRIGALLEDSGVLPLHAQRVVEELRSLHGEFPPDSLAQEVELARTVLLGRWQKAASPREIGSQKSEARSPKSDLRPPTSDLRVTRDERRIANPDTHVFIGPPGSGKTTSLCKWLALTVLVEGRRAAVWRLDGQVANTAETLSVYCEILGVPLERFVPPASVARAGEVLFIDLPGVNPGDAAAFSGLAEQLGRLPNPQVHLVLNAAYETPQLLAQARAFAALPLTDLIVTHLDEEPRWGKLWNFVLAPWSSGQSPESRVQRPGSGVGTQNSGLRTRDSDLAGRGTNCTLRFLSAGQNIPGEFLEASPDQILARHFPAKPVICGGSTARAPIVAKVLLNRVTD